VNNLRTIGGGAGQIAVAYAEPPVSPPVSRPITGVPTQAPVHVSTPVAPVAVASAAPSSSAEPPAPAVAAAPTPAPAPQTPAQQAPVDQTVAVFVNLSSGERVWAGRFDSPDLAEQRATEIVRALIRPEPGVWAKFGNRLIRPSAVVSIELAPRRED
jgi:hypothetical protein